MTKAQLVLTGIVLLFLPVWGTAFLAVNGNQAHDVQVGAATPEWTNAPASNGWLNFLNSNHLFGSAGEAEEGAGAESPAPLLKPYIMLLLVTGIVGLAGGSRRI